MRKAITTVAVLASLALPAAAQASYLDLPRAESAMLVYVFPNEYDQAHLTKCHRWNSTTVTCRVTEWNYGQAHVGEWLTAHKERNGHVAVKGSTIE